MELYSLLFYRSKIKDILTHSQVSVSSRSYILSYKNKQILFKISLKVSVSSRSYILSYRQYKILLIIHCSFIVSVSSRSYILSYERLIKVLKEFLEKVSVSSRSYILSYAPYTEFYGKVIIKEFPSPLGVIFSLI